MKELLCEKVKKRASPYVVKNYDGDVQKVLKFIFFSGNNEPRRLTINNIPYTIFIIRGEYNGKLAQFKNSSLGRYGFAV